jgi:hypothetical protein
MGVDWDVVRDVVRVMIIAIAVFRFMDGSTVVMSIGNHR